MQACVPRAAKQRIYKQVYAALLCALREGGQHEILRRDGYSGGEILF